MDSEKAYLAVVLGLVILIPYLFTRWLDWYWDRHDR